MNARLGIMKHPGPFPTVSKYRSLWKLTSENIGHFMTESFRAVWREIPSSVISSVLTSNCFFTRFQMRLGVSGTATKKINRTAAPPGRDQPPTDTRVRSGTGGSTAPRPRPDGHQFH